MRLYIAVPVSSSTRIQTRTGPFSSPSPIAFFVRPAPAQHAVCPRPPRYRRAIPPRLQIGNTVSFRSGEGAAPPPFSSPWKSGAIPPLAFGLRRTRYDDAARMQAPVLFIYKKKSFGRQTAWTAQGISGFSFLGPDAKTGG